MSPRETFAVTHGMTAFSLLQKNRPTKTSPHSPTHTMGLTARRLVAIALVSCGASTAAPVFSTYIDKVTQWWPPEAIAAGMALPGYAADTDYNVINLAFWTRDGPADLAIVWADLYTYVSADNPWGNSTAEVQAAWRKLYNDAGIRIVVSAFGATDFPTSAGASASETCDDITEFVLANQLDGVDLDWEDNAAMEAGTGEAWLIECVKTIRARLPRDEYVVTMAPQGPYFTDIGYYPNGAMLAVDAAVGAEIDWYNVQFYNQGDTEYNSYETLFETAEGYFKGTAVAEMVANGVAPEKIVVGKPVTTGDATNTGWMAAADLAVAFTKASAELGWSAGAMTWQFPSDADGAFVATLASAL